MKLNLLSCNAKRPDKRAIANCIETVSSSIDSSLATELTDILLEGDAIEVEVDDNNLSSSYRALRKMGIDYEIVE